MDDFLFVKQPPLGNYFTLLVDDINETSTIGYTSNIKKIEYNRGIIDSMGLELNFKIQVQTAFSDKGIITVLLLGRYISILKVSRFETQQEMFFIDSTANANFRIQNDKALHGYFSENIVKEFEKIHSVLSRDFSKEFDLVELLLTKNL
jgi:hypothetical protein